MCHYIHLNPVRAGLVEVGRLEGYAHSSFAHLWKPGKRNRYEVMETALSAAGGLADTPAGRRSYRDYLTWLSADEEASKSLGFDKMSRGWAKGTKDFKKAVLEDFNDRGENQIVEAEAAEVREPAWERALDKGLATLKRVSEDLEVAPKGADWKVALARHLREGYLAPHRWIAENLRMGAPTYVQSLVSRHRSGSGCKHWKALKKT